MRSCSCYGFVSRNDRVDAVVVVVTRLQHVDDIPGAGTFHEHFKAAVTGMVYRCMTFNLIMASAPADVRRKQLLTLVTRTVAGVQEYILA
jgi:histidinol phosphatase-like PHP family hydrolase